MIEERTGRNFTLKSLPEGLDGNAAEIWRTAQNLFEKGDVVEVRAFKGRKTASGYFNDFEALANRAASLDNGGYQVYVTLNPVMPALLSRYCNRIEHGPEATTKDGEISQRRWLPIDLDPVRPTLISASDEEKRAAFERANEIKGYLEGKEFYDPIEADSGDGAHLLYRIELPNDPESLTLVSGVLRSLDSLFSDNVVNVDKSVVNAARLWKLYGTTARKGDDSEDRPHRRSRLLKVPGSSEMSSGIRRIEPCE
ncbi:MAG: hypothetical protein M3475_08910 [Actinomycetota bacterium]|nr:hypothetical protein [Actinomycetota bacterium]